MNKKLMSVHEVAELTGITARTLHYYDEIGLLKPTKVTEAGYRMYDDTALSRLQNILLFRELEFPLKEIKEILNSPNFDPSEVIAQQIELLELQYKHIGELITFTREIQKKGVTAMNFDVFDKSEIEKYEAEVKAKWGNTKAYQEYKQKDIPRNGVYTEISKENAGLSLQKERKNRKAAAKIWKYTVNPLFCNSLPLLSEFLLSLACGFFPMS